MFTKTEFEKTGFTKTGFEKTGFPKTGFEKTGFEKTESKNTQFKYHRPKTNHIRKIIQKNSARTKTISAQKWSRPRKMRSREKFALACLLTYAVYMMQMAQHF